MSDLQHIGIRIPFIVGIFLVVTQICPSQSLQGNYLSILFDSCLYAQDSKPKFPYENYGDRKEGIVKSKELVGGQKIELVSASIETEEPASISASHYNLAYYSPDSFRIRLVVREFENLYRMEPIFSTFPAGLRKFSWPSQIPLYYKIPITKLSPFAEVAGSAGEKIIPVLIYNTEPQDISLRYRFCYVPHLAVLVLEYEIYESNHLSPVYTGTPRRDLDKEKVECLDWDGKDKNNKMVKDGWYYWAIKVTFKPAPGGNPIIINLNHQFYHYAEILKTTVTAKK